MTTQDKLAQALRDMVEASQGKFGDLVFMAKASQDAAEALAEHEAQVQAAPENHFAGVSNMVPDGYRLVPVDPTDAMRIAGGIALESSPAHDVIGPLVDAWAAMLAAAPQPEAAQDDWRTPTTLLQRMSDAVALLCGGKRPSNAMVQGWLDNTSEELQNFAASHGPAWAQGIGLLDAARVMADQPVEGVDHEMAPQPEAVQQVGRHIDKQAEFEAWLENYPIQIIEDDYELCFDAFMAGLAAQQAERANGIGKDKS
jgi:hypothetical protein